MSLRAHFAEALARRDWARGLPEAPVDPTALAAEAAQRQPNDGRLRLARPTRHVPRHRKPEEG